MLKCHLRQGGQGVAGPPDSSTVSGRCPALGRRCRGLRCYWTEALRNVTPSALIYNGTISRRLLSRSPARGVPGDAGQSRSFRAPRRSRRQQGRQVETADRSAGLSCRLLLRRNRWPTDEFMRSALTSMQVNSIYADAIRVPISPIQLSRKTLRRRAFAILPLGSKREAALPFVLAAPARAVFTGSPQFPRFLMTK